MKKTIIIITTIFILWVITSALIYYNTNFNKYNLNNIGYNSMEIENIKKNCSEEEINIIKKHKYNKQIINIINSEQYKKDNLSKYLDYYKNNININDLIYIVNNNLDTYSYTNFLSNIINSENFNINNIEKYLEYEKSEIDSNVIIYIVNNNIDTKLEILKELQNNKYFILKNLDRYIKYYNNTNETIENTIKNINTNLDKEFYVDITETNYNKDLLIIVNKYYYLDKNYVPDNIVSVGLDYTTNNCRLRQDAYTAYLNMIEAARKEGLDFYIRSGYRSYNDQQNIYTSYVNNDGVILADTYSARPGHSEHQTGLAIDLIAGRNGTYDQFYKTKEFDWLKVNSYKYGFILRYTEENSYITGYKSEPWHYRYVGINAAKTIYEENLTFEEYYEYYVNR